MHILSCFLILYIYLGLKQYSYILLNQYLFLPTYLLLPCFLVISCNFVFLSRIIFLLPEKSLYFFSLIQITGNKLNCNSVFLSGNVYILPALLKDNFLEYKILGCHLFFSLKLSFYCHLHLLSLIKKISYFPYCVFLEGNVFYTFLASFNFWFVSFFRKSYSDESRSGLFMFILPGVHIFS